uniref:Uncharacterized protein n=1 Tax=Arundo donax TaxID=35708 RepID=A0A0A9FZ10_ARUDO
MRRHPEESTGELGSAWFPGKGHLARLGQLLIVALPSVSYLATKPNTYVQPNRAPFHPNRPERFCFPDVSLPPASLYPKKIATFCGFVYSISCFMWWSLKDGLCFCLMGCVCRTSCWTRRA